MRYLIILLLLVVFIPTQAQVQLEWFNYPGGVSVATDASNNVYTANWDYNAGGDITLTKRDAAGNLLWAVPIIIQIIPDTKSPHGLKPIVRATYWYRVQSGQGIQIQLMLQVF
ncbi:MAG: hypothetical protein IPJ37_16525 [Bacteroidales bacterium]|nr:hypothetical protein [Bacteroidales bacterium]